jgi:hypothetical protein
MLAQLYLREVACDIGETSLFVEASQEAEIALIVGRNLLSGLCHEQIPKRRGSG